jgi:hypothetical protein
MSATTSVKKTKFRKTIPTKDKKGSIQQQILEQKNTFLAIKVENIMSQKSNFNFVSKFCRRFFLLAANFRRLKNQILKGL